MQQAIGTVYSSLLSILFGMMIVSFPVGAYVFFDSKGDITHEYPMTGVDAAYETIFESMPFEIGIGDVFVVFWSAFAILFIITTMGPRQGFIRTLLHILGRGIDTGSNRMITVLKWFGIIVFSTVVIDTVQGQFGIVIEPPDFGDERILFLETSMAPIIEEVGFRVLLIGVPLYCLFYRRSTVWSFLKSLWHPYGNLDVTDPRKVMVLIIGIGIMFGLAHVMFGQQWSTGKGTQAALGGVILGWVYYRHGLAAAIMLHWATNYFIISYMYFVAHAADVPLFDAATNPMITTLELIFVMSGAVSFVFLISSRLAQNRQGGSEHIHDTAGS